MANSFIPPSSGISVRMYRQGHGDCFLLTTKDRNDDPYYILIDCGLIRGSQIKEIPIGDIVQHIADSTNNHLNLVVITHEHQDHVSAFNSAASKAIFEDIQIDKLWLPWTEDPNHDLANRLREKYNDTLIHLLISAKKLRGMASNTAIQKGKRIRDLLAFDIDEDQLELFDNPDQAVFSAASIKGITNKKAMKFVKDKARENDGIEFLRPHQQPLTLPEVEGIRVFVMGPPEEEAKLKDLDPHHDEAFEFKLANIRRTESAVFNAVKDRNPAYKANEEELKAIEWQYPFASYHRLHEDRLAESDYEAFFKEHYYEGKEGEAIGWRKIGEDWLYDSENFAIRMSNYINNTSLVLAFELPSSKKVMLFVGDAQRGNWVSWHDKDWSFENEAGDSEVVTTENLLNRTVFYKVGHHGSHNASLSKGGVDQMAKGAFQDHFVAMIPANPTWAKHKSHPWMHPFPPIYKALREKSKGRLFISGRKKISKPVSTSDAVWDEFKDLSKEGKLYVEYTVLDKL